MAGHGHSSAGPLIDLSLQGRGSPPPAGRAPLGRLIQMQRSVPAQASYAGVKLSANAQEQLVPAQHGGSTSCTSANVPPLVPSSPIHALPCFPPPSCRPAAHAARLHTTARTRAVGGWSAGKRGPGRGMSWRQRRRQLSCHRPSLALCMLFHLLPAPLRCTCYNKCSDKAQHVGMRLSWCASQCAAPCAPLGRSNRCRPPAVRAAAERKCWLPETARQN